MEKWGKSEDKKDNVMAFFSEYKNNLSFLPDSMSKPDH